MSQHEAGDAVNRPLANFAKDIWGDNFLNFSDQDNLRLESYVEDIEPLKEEVRVMLMEDKYVSTVGKKMSLINTVERLGFSYFFEDEIKELLDWSFETVVGTNFDMGTDLCEIALQFRVFRQHGYNMPSGVFNKFTNGEGKFKETLKSDVKGMVSLYEAAHLRMHDEYILDEALIFTTNFLEMVANSSKEARLALKHPLHHTMPRVDTRYFISIYEEDEFRNQTLLHLAKIDFNRLQLLYRKELSQLQRWWKSLNLTKKLPYIRDRSVESYLAANGTYFEPQYSQGRLLLAKVVAALTVWDDTYDAYGTLQELLLLTQALNRWDLSLMDQLSDIMKIVYEFTINLFEDFVKEATGKSFVVESTKETSIQLVRCYMEEVKRREASYIPSYKEFIGYDQLITGLGRVMLVSSLMGMDEITNEKPFQVIKQVPNPIRALDFFCRITNDIYSHEEEQTRGDAPSSVECYMKEHGTNRQETVKIFEKMLDDAWKDLNQELSKDDHDHDDHEKKEGFPKILLKLSINICRMVTALYTGKDGFTYPAEVIKDLITSLYAVPFSI